MFMLAGRIFELVDLDLLRLLSNSITEDRAPSREGREEDGEVDSAGAACCDLAASWLSRLDSLEPELATADIGLLASDDRGRLEGRLPWFARPKRVTDLSFDGGGGGEGDVIVPVETMEGLGGAGETTFSRGTLLVAS